jgi:4-alpha-glucanotransferase
MMSVVDMAFFGLGAEARMNKLGTMRGNWMWRLSPEQLTPSVTRELSKITKIYGRARTTKRKR